MPHQAGFDDLETETPPTTLAVSGAIPHWLTGSLIRTGPAKFSAGKQSFHHWFDGLAMLHRFSFAGEAATYTSRFLQSQAFKRACREGKIASHEFATNPQESLLQRLSGIFAYQPTDNGNVNVTMSDGCFLALTETPTPVQFDPGNLSTLGAFSFSGENLHGQVTTAHPHSYAGIQYNLLIKMGARSVYQIYALDCGSRARRLIASMPVQRPAYIHSFAVTQRYLLLIESPLRINPLELILSGKPYIENYHWQNGESMRFLVFDKNNGQLLKVLEGDSGFFFHTVNAYERGREIIIDAAMYKDAQIIDALYLENLRSAECIVPAAVLTRFVVNLDSGKTRTNLLLETGMELPRINYERVNGESYKYVFSGGVTAPGVWIDQLLKTDTESSYFSRWRQGGCFPGEPVFVAEPGSVAEDQGVIMSLVFDSVDKSSFLLGLDGQSMQEMFRVRIPNVIPFHFHGQYFREV